MMGNQPKSLIPLSMARSAVSAAQNPFTLWAAGQQTAAKSGACCSGSAVSFVVTSFVMMSASVRLGLSAGKEPSHVNTSKPLTVCRRVDMWGSHLTGRDYYIRLTDLSKNRLSSQNKPVFISNLRANPISLVYKFKLVTALTFRLVSSLNISMKAIKKKLPEVVYSQSLLKKRM